MIEIKDKHKCVGCKACNLVCPRDCISFNYDNEGFIYPLVDKALCIKCGRCDRVCPVINRYKTSLPIEAYAAKSKDTNVVRNSSSGGIFYALAKRVLDKGGVVFGVRYNDKWNAVYHYCESESELSHFMGSKYVQANPGDSFNQVKEFLEADRYVLFVGTPCYVAALKRFLTRNYVKLLLVDFICHGVPSPKVWNKFKSKYVVDNNIKNVSFRDKTNGWRGFSLNFKSNDNENIILKQSDNLYFKAFMKNIILRPSCYKCPSKGYRSMSDITVADFWGIEKVMKIKDDNTGISFVTVNSNQGNRWFNGLNDIEKDKVSFSDAIIYNDHLLVSSYKNIYREKFFQNIDKKDIVDNLNESLKKSQVNKLIYKFNLKIYTLIRLKYLKLNKKR